MQDSCFCKFLCSFHWGAVLRGNSFISVFHKRKRFKSGHTGSNFDRYSIGYLGTYVILIEPAEQQIELRNAPFHFRQFPLPLLCSDNPLGQAFLEDISPKCILPLTGKGDDLLQAFPSQDLPRPPCEYSAPCSYAPGAGNFRRGTLPNPVSGSIY
jgi:hypothetical protein